MGDRPYGLPGRTPQWSRSREGDRSEQRQPQPHGEPAAAMEPVS